MHLQTIKAAKDLLLKQDLVAVVNIDKGDFDLQACTVWAEKPSAHADLSTHPELSFTLSFDVVL